MHVTSVCSVSLFYCRNACATRWTCRHEVCDPFLCVTAYTLILRSGWERPHSSHSASAWALRAGRPAAAPRGATTKTNEPRGTYTGPRCTCSPFLGVPAASRAAGAHGRMGCCTSRLKRRLRPKSVTFGDGVIPGGAASSSDPRMALVRTKTTRTAAAEQMLDQCAARLDQFQESADAACEQAREVRRGILAGEQISVALKASNTQLLRLLHKAEIELERPLDSIEVSGITGEVANRDRRRKLNRRLSEVIGQLETEQSALDIANAAADVSDVASPDDPAGATIPLADSLPVDSRKKHVISPLETRDDYGSLVDTEIETSLRRNKTARSEGAAEALSHLEARLVELEERTNAAVASANREELQLVLHDAEFDFQKELDAVSVLGFTEESGLRERRKECNRKLQTLQARLDAELTRPASGASEPSSPFNTTLVEASA